MKRRLLHFLMVIDMLLYQIITLGYGSPLETCSAAAWRIEQTGGLFWFMRPVIDTLFFFDPNHCEVSFNNLKNLKYLPEAYQR